MAITLEVINTMVVSSIGNKYDCDKFSW